MNFKYIPIQDKIYLSKLGLNCSYAKANKIDVLKELYSIKERIINNDIEIYYIICEDKLIKKETFFKNVWTCRNNIYPSRLHKILKDEHMKNIILNRIDMMLLFISNTAY